jgi:hypothetical protein
MAYIGLYGVYYSKATLTDGQVDGYSGASTMGKAISATFTPQDSGENNLYANNAIAETDSAAAAGGTLSLTIDRLKADAIADLFGLTKKTESVTVGTTTVSGTGFDYTGNESAATVGVAFIRQKQEDNDRNFHEAIIFSAVTFSYPSDDAQTLGDSVEWQTPTIEGTITANTGALPWCKRYTFPTQAAAEAFIEDYFAAS